MTYQSKYGPERHPRRNVLNSYQASAYYIVYNIKKYKKAFCILVESAHRRKIFLIYCRGLAMIPTVISPHFDPGILVLVLTGKGFLYLAVQVSPGLALTKLNNSDCHWVSSQSAASSNSLIPDSSRSVTPSFTERTQVSPINLLTE